MLIFFALPWLDRGTVKSIRYRGTLYKAWLAAFVVRVPDPGLPRRRAGHRLGPVRRRLADPRRRRHARPCVARVLTVVYFLFFLLMPWYTARDKTKPVPDRVTWMKQA